MKSSSCSDAVSGSAEDEDRRQRGRKPEREAHRRHLLEGQLEREEAAEDGAERPERRRAERVEDRRQAVQRDVERARKRHQPGPGEAAERERAPKRGRGRSPSSAAASDTAISGWTFWRTTGVTGSPCTNASVKRIVASADDPAPIDDPRGHEARAGAPEGRKRGHDDGEQDGDEDDVLAEDDRRRLGRNAQADGGAARPCPTVPPRRRRRRLRCSLCSACLHSANQRPRCASEFT